MTRLTHVFDFKTKDNLLIVMPRGDATSFRGVDIEREMHTIKDHMQQNNLWKVAVDLSGAKFFGSLILGVLNSIGQHAKDNHGQMVMFGASTQMVEVLKLMKLSDVWPVFPEEKHAIKVLKAWIPGS